MAWNAYALNTIKKEKHDYPRWVVVYANETKSKSFEFKHLAVAWKNKYDKKYGPGDASIHTAYDL